MLLTNKFHVAFNMERIDQDYDIYLVKKTKDLYKTNILDLPTVQFHARAVQYSFGSKALVLFEKNDISLQAFRAAITEVYPDAEISKLDILNEEVCDAQFYHQKRLLLQLLVNSIRVPTVEGFQYNNLTGKLFYWNPQWKSCDQKTNELYAMYFLEITFDPGVYLNLNVKTFRRKTYSRNGRSYIIDPKTGNFRRKLQSDNGAPEEVFVEEAFDKSRNTVPYLDFSSFEAFRKCKLGIMEQFLHDVRKELGQYITLTAEQREGDICYHESKKEKDHLSGVDYAALLDDPGVNIVDLCQTEKSNLIVKRLVEEFQKFYGITVSIGELQKSKYNIRLIHEPQYYEDNLLPDPHEDDLHGFIVQHMTQEHADFAGKSGDRRSPKVHKIVTELILKGDVHRGQISIYNWSKLNSDKTWTFVRRDKIKAPEGEKFDCVQNAVGEKTYDRFAYTTVQIDQQGKMAFRAFDDQSFTTDPFEEKIRYAYDNFVSEQKHGQKDVEGLVFSDIANIHAIIKTKEKTMPNTAALWNALKATNVKDAVLTDMILEAAEDYRERFPEYVEYADYVISELKDKPNVIKKGEIKKIMDLRKYKKAGKKFNRFLHEQYDIWVAPELKDSDFSDDFMLENVTEIKYFEDTHTDGKDLVSLNYYAGPAKSSLKFSVNNASIVRQVQAQEEVEFKELLPLMAVDFVRIGQFTVLPFPFKYLREYRNFL